MTTSEQDVSQGQAQDHSKYLVDRLLNGADVNLFNHVKFHLLKQEIDRLGLIKPKVLDIGCGAQVSRRYLTSLNLDFDYFGVDYEARLEPDAIIDLRDPEEAMAHLPWEPEVVVMLDVLEHLHEDIKVLETMLGGIKATLPEEITFILTLPQLYRLDRFKLPHLHYPEHKIRLTQEEWLTLISTHFDIQRVQGLGYLSVIPYLPMASKSYRNDNWLGRTFRYLRGEAFEWEPLKPVDLWLSNTLGKKPAFQTLSNDFLVVATPRSDAP